MKGRLLMAPDGYIWLKFAFQAFYKTFAEDLYNRGYHLSHKGEDPWCTGLDISAATMMAQALFSERLKAFYGTDIEFAQINRGKWRNEQALPLIQSGLFPHEDSPHGDEYIYLVKSDFDAFMERFLKERTYVPTKAKQRKTKTGPDPIVLERVKSEMRCRPRVELENMKQTAMASIFGASRPTCVRALQEVLSELDAD